MLDPYPPPWYTQNSIQTWLHSIYQARRCAQAGFSVGPIALVAAAAAYLVATRVRPVVGVEPAAAAPPDQPPDPPAAKPRRVPAVENTSWRPSVDLDVPRVPLPSVDLDLPDLDVPRVSLPRVRLPSVDLDLPRVALPSVNLDVPDLSDLPSVPAPIVAAFVDVASGIYQIWRRDRAYRYYYRDVYRTIAALYAKTRRLDVGLMIPAALPDARLSELQLTPFEQFAKDRHQAARLHDHDNPAEAAPGSGAAHARRRRDRFSQADDRLRLAVVYGVHGLGNGLRHYLALSTAAADDIARQAIEYPHGDTTAQLALQSAARTHEPLPDWTEALPDGYVPASRQPAVDRRVTGIPVKGPAPALRAER